MRAISSIRYKISTDDEGKSVRDVEIKLWDKPGPLKLAGRHVGLFDEKAKTDDEPRETHIHINGLMPPIPPELAGKIEAAVGPETTTTGDPYVKKPGGQNG